MEKRKNVGLKTNPSQVTAQASPVGDVEKERCLKDKEVGRRKHLRGDPVEDVLKLVQERRHLKPQCSGCAGSKTQGLWQNGPQGTSSFSANTEFDVLGTQKGAPCEQKGQHAKKGQLRMPLEVLAECQLLIYIYVL